MWSIRGTRGSNNYGSATKRWVELFLVFLILLVPLAAAADQAIYTSDFGLSFLPTYRPIKGQTITLRLRAFHPAQKVTLYSDREQEVPLKYSDGSWRGEFTLPLDYQDGSHFFTIWVRYPFAREPENNKNWLSGLLPGKKRANVFWSKNVVWYQVGSDLVRVESPSATVTEEGRALPILIASGEAEISVPAVSLETSGILIKGTQSITFKSHSIEGSKEGEVSGTTQAREETLRVSLSGKSDGTEIEGSLFRTSVSGLTPVSQPDDKITLVLRRASTEAYLGDFTADLNDTEFSRLNKVLSGVKLKGDYDRWGFTALYSSPKGLGQFTRMYGNGTQGPYSLGQAPVVIDSERVTVNGVSQKRGDDYNIDYQAGTITFVKKIIDPLWIIQANYDFRQTVFEHATYAARGYFKPRPNLKVGASYLNDSDLTANAAEIRQSMSGEAVDPQSHWVAGTDVSFVSENLTAYGEGAYSLKNLNLLAPSGSEESGKAAKFGLSGSLGPVGLTFDWKRVGAKFEAIADPDPKQDVWENAGTLSYRPNSLFGLQAGQNYQKYTQSGVVYENTRHLGRAQLTPENFPSLEYNYQKHNESNDPVTGSSIQRTITRDSLETIYQPGFLAISLKGTKEQWLNRAPSEEATDYRRVNFGLATVGIEKVTFATNLELEDRRMPDGTQPYRHSYNLNLSTTPVKQFFASASLQIIDDTAQGNTTVTELSYKADPFPFFKTDGKYSINSLLQDFPTTAEAASKQSGSFNFELRPNQAARLRYLYKPNFTQIVRTGTLSNNNEQRQMEISLAPLKTTMLGWLYKIGHGFNVYNGDYPNYQVKQNSQETDSTLYTIKVAPYQPISIELDYLLDNARNLTLLTTGEPYVYQPGVTVAKQLDAIIKTSLTEKFSIDSRYTYRKTDQGSGEAANNVADTVSHTGSLKGTWNISESWSASIYGSFNRLSDRLLSLVTYTYSPGFGFTCRSGDALRVDFDNSYSQSYAGAATEKYDVSLKGRYALSNFVNVTLQVFREISRQPDYRQTDVTGNVEINL